MFSIDGFDNDFGDSIFFFEIRVSKNFFPVDLGFKLGFDYVRCCFPLNRLGFCVFNRPG